MIELRVLGSLDLRGSQGEALLSVLAQPKRVALLAYLAVATPHGCQRRDKLLGLFWAERDQEHARAALRTAIYFLRQSLGEEVLASRTDEEVGLAEGAVWCDAVAFEGALDAGELEEALELYRGDLLEGFYISEAPEFERWLEGERSRLQGRAAEAAWALAAAEEGKGNRVEAAHWARRAAALTPDDEGVLRRLVELLSRVADRAGAVREYEAFAGRLKEDVGLEPSAEMQALIASIREQEVASRAGREQQAGVTVPQPRALVVRPVPEAELGGDPRAQPRRLAEAAMVGYCGLISLAVLAVVYTVMLELGLPGWFFWGTILVLVCYLPIILTTAFVQGCPTTAGLVREPGVRRVFTWRNVVLGGMGLVALWGLALAGWLLFVDGPVPEGQRTAAAQIRRVAVLPAQYLPADPGQEYFADGITDQLINNLCKIRALEVISRTSVMRYKGTDKSVPEIAGELRVDALVELSVFRAEDRVRITAQLIEAATERNLWAESYERDVRDMLALQNEVAQAIARQVRVTLTPEDEARLAGGRPVNPEAEEAYLKGRFFSLQFTPEAPEKGIAYLRQAIELDPQDPRPYAALADAYIVLAICYARGFPREAAFEEAETAAAKAIKLDQSLGEARAVLGLVRLYHHWDWPGAERELRRAIEVSPYSAFAHWGLSRYLALVGQLDEAIAESRRAQELDPLSPVIGTSLALYYYLAGEYDRTIAEAREMLELDPDFAGALWILGAAFERKGMYDEAIAAQRRAVEENPAFAPLLAVTYAVAGQPEEARRILAGVDEQTKRREALFVSGVYASLGDIDQAFEWVETAYEEGDPAVHWLRLCPHLEGLRDDPRYHDPLQRMNFPD
jgi:TolB-like protein/DNA-binding SARP family transcriptional activator/Tfp pilus assembly protein PilF